MSETVDAVYDQGVFRPCAPVSISNGQRVTLTYSPASNSEPVPAWPELPPELAKNSDGVIMARGSRISLFFLLEGHFAGTPWPEMREDLPTVQAEDWKRIEDFVRHNEAALRPYFEKQHEIAESYRKPTPPELTLETLRERFEKKHGAPFPKP